MVKKITALILSLAMVLSFTANFTGVMAATEGVNVVSIKYYADKALTQEITDVKKGENFYAAVSLANFSQIIGAELTIGYDTDYLQLLDASGNDVIIDNTNTSIQGKNYLEQKDIVGKDNSSVVVASSGVYPRLLSKEKLAMIGLLWGGFNIVDVQDEVVCVKMQFEAKKKGTTQLSIPCRTNDAIYDERNEYGINVGTMAQGEPYYLDDCDVNISSLTISTEQLKAPDVEFDVENRLISWNAIDKASGYKVAVKVSKNGGEPTYNKTFDVASTETSMNLPAEITNGDVTVSVMAVSNDTEIGSSDYSAEKTGIVTLDLNAPANVAWDGEKVKWDAVDDAVGYTVNLMLNDNQTPVATIANTTETTVDFSSELKTPTEGKNSYVVTVKALGDKVYTFDSAEEKTKEKNICGSVKSVVSAEWNGNAATWVENDDKANVAGYIVCVKKDGAEVYTNSMENLVQGSSIDVSDYIKDPGKYTFTVTAIGASTQDGEYKNSSAKSSKNTKTVSKQLDPVENIEWSDRVLTWTDNNKNTSVYEVKLYKGTEPVGTYPNITETKIDFDAVGANIGAGTYKVEIIAKGNGETYLDSEKAESEKEFTARLDDPQNVKWNGTKADWDTVANANAYEIALFYNGVDTGIREYAYEPETEFDLAEDLTMPGEYTFTVKALANNGYSASKAVNSQDAYQNTETTTGNVYIDVYTDAECTTPATNVKVGDVFYAAVAVENTAPFMSFSAPVKFNPEYVKVVDADGAVATDGVAPEGVITVAEEFTLIENEDHPYVDNTNGLVKIAAFAGTDVTVTTKKNVAVIKMIAVGMSNTNELTFAVANTENPDSYDASSMSGFGMADITGLLFAEDKTPTTVAIAKGQLAKMAAPVWSNSTLTWVKAAGNNAVGYEIELYRDGNLIETIKIDDANVTSENMSAYTSTSGTYTAKIKALADNVGAIDGEYSEPSEGYTVSYGGGGFGGGKKPTKPVEPDKPDEPDKPVDPEKPEFTDIDGHWAEKDILELVDLGIVDGYGDNTFRPNLGITRAEFTKLMVTCLGLELEGEGHVYDDTANHWAKDYIAIGTEIGIVNGIGENLFDPDRIITREQVAAIIYRMAGEPEVAASTFVDRDEISDYAKPAVDYVSSEGIMIGIGNNMFGGRDNINRAQMATVVLRLWKANFFANYKN